MAKADNILERMRRSKSGWKRKDFDTLYLGFGFEIRTGASHDIVSHPDYPDLRQTLPRHRVLATGYAQVAVKLIDELIKRQGGSDE